MTLMHDKNVGRPANAYPENVNYAFYELLWAMGLVMLCLFAALELIKHY